MQARNQPRLFDNIRPVRIGPKDLEPLELTSSMAPVRNAALRKQAEQRRRMAAMPKRSRLYSDPEEPKITITTNRVGLRIALCIGPNGHVFMKICSIRLERRESRRALWRPRTTARCCASRCRPPRRPRACPRGGRSGRPWRRPRSRGALAPRKRRWASAAAASSTWTPRWPGPPSRGVASSRGRIGWAPPQLSRLLKDGAQLAFEGALPGRGRL